jgi:hypothetical protein
MHRKGYEIGLQVGNTSFAALHKGFRIARELHSGTNLLELKEELDLDIKMAEQIHAFPVLGMKIQIYYKAVLTLIGDESSNSHSNLDGDLIFDQEAANVWTSMMTLTYLGFYERAKHMAKRWELLSGENQSKKMISFRDLYVCFYYGVASIGLQRKKYSKSTRTREITNKWLEGLQNAAKCSKWNFLNKASLLLAEKLSLNARNSEAEEQYDIAINASRSSNFIHEEGLACELAALHYRRLGNDEKAIALFCRAEKCYEVWGSVVKTRQVREKIHSVNPQSGILSSSCL